LKRCTNAADFVKIAQGICPCGAFIFQIRVLGSYTLIVAPIGVNEICHGSSMPNFTPSVQRVVPEGRKTSKYASE